MTTGERAVWAMAAVGLGGSALGWMTAPADFPHAWLAAVTFWIGWPLGSLALIFIHALTGGRWGLAIRRQLAMAVATMPLILPALIPILVAGRLLYPWMQPAADSGLANRFYLNAPFFYARLAIYLIAWLGLALATLRALRRVNPEPHLSRLAPGGLILLALTVTFFAVDFTLSLEPQFKSSIYGMLTGSEAVLLALSAALMGASLMGGGGDPDAARDLGRLLFGLLVLWAYLDFMQLLIVWNSNLPDEAGWYGKRLAGFWGTLAVIVAVFHFVLPFLVLIWPRVQRSRRATGLVAAMLVAAEIPRAWWIVIPAARRGVDWTDAAAMTAMIGIAAGIAIRILHNERLPARPSSHA